MAAGPVALAVPRPSKRSGCGATTRSSTSSSQRAGQGVHRGRCRDPHHGGAWGRRQPPAKLQRRPRGRRARARAQLRRRGDPLDLADRLPDQLPRPRRQRVVPPRHRRRRPRGQPRCDPGQAPRPGQGLVDRLLPPPGRPHGGPAPPALGAGRAHRPDPDLREPARAEPAGRDDRLTDRPQQPALPPRPARARARPRRARPLPGVADHLRPRQLQADQRHPRAPRRRRGPQACRRGSTPAAAPVEHDLPLRRRRVLRDCAGGRRAGGRAGGAPAQG